MTIRPGSSKIYSGLGTNVHSLHTVELVDGTTYRMVGADDSLLINGVQQATDITGSGDLAFGDDSYQVFAARGTTKLKWDGVKVRNWGIAAPVSAPTLAAVASITKSVATFDASESPAVVIVEGTGAAGNTTDYDGTASAATQVTPNTSTYRSVVTRTYASSVDYMDISGVAGSLPGVAHPNQ